MKKAAAIDPSGHYRYSLGREWDVNAPRITFIMLNPSFADADRDDPTLRRCIGFARYWGYGSLEVVNLFAYRTANPTILEQVRDPIGCECDRYIKIAVETADRIIVAWGNKGILRNRCQVVLDRLNIDRLYCLGMTQKNQPRHPLYVKKTAKLYRYLP